MITIRNSVRKEISSVVPTLLQQSIEWMRRKYPDINFDNVDFIFSAGYSRSRYFRNENQDAKYKVPMVCISTRPTLYLYDKKRLGIKKNSIYVGSKTQIMCALIHELTHHVQYEQDIRKGNETDTTRNELEWLKEYSVEDYNEITNGI